MHGKDMNIPKGTEITAYVNSNVQLDRAKFDVQGQSAPSLPNAPVSAANPSTVQGAVSVSSTPPGADVEVDGSFMGNTPSQISLTAGDHTIKISKTGFETWEKKVKISSGAINLNADLTSFASQK